MGNAPAPVTRGALERVLARAAELQAAKGDAPESAGLSDAQILEVGAEVGLSPEHLRQALAEERARGGSLPERAGSERWLVSAQRVVPGGPDVVMAALDRWMLTEEWLRVKRQQVDRMVWEPRRDVVAEIRRAITGRAHALRSVTEVAGSVVAVDQDRSLVALSANLSGRHAAMVGQIAGGTMIGVAASGALAMMGFMTVVAVAPIVVAAPLAIFGARRAMEASTDRTQLALEQILDRLERRSTEPGRPSLMQMIDSALPRLR